MMEVKRKPSELPVFENWLYLTFLGSRKFFALVKNNRLVIVFRIISEILIRIIYYSGLFALEF